MELTIDGHKVCHSPHHQGLRPRGQEGHVPFDDDLRRREPVVCQGVATEEPDPDSLPPRTHDARWASAGSASSTSRARRGLCPPASGRSSPAWISRPSSPVPACNRASRRSWNCCWPITIRPGTMYSWSTSTLNTVKRARTSWRPSPAPWESSGAAFPAAPASGRATIHRS